MLQEAKGLLNGYSDGQLFALLCFGHSTGIKNVKSSSQTGNQIDISPSVNPSACWGGVIGQEAWAMPSHPVSGRLRYQSRSKGGVSSERRYCRF